MNKFEMLSACLNMLICRTHIHIHNHTHYHTHTRPIADSLRTHTHTHKHTHIPTLTCARGHNARTHTEYTHHYVMSTFICTRALHPWAHVSVGMWVCLWVWVCALHSDIISIAFIDTPIYIQMHYTQTSSNYIHNNTTMTHQYTYKYTYFLSFLYPHNTNTYPTSA